MKLERWRQVDQLFQAALERAPEERAVFISAACDGDDSLRCEVEALLTADVQAGSLIEAPAYAVAAPLLAEDGSRSLAGKSVSHYQIISLLGAGGMGEVYRARDTKLDRIVALKILPEEMSADGERMRRFSREAKAASALNHSNVAHIYEIGEAEGVIFIAMECVEGQTLAAKINGKPLEVNEIVEIGSQIADALDEAHGKGITHRDIKPANVMLTPRGQVKVLDFGLAKIARPAQPIVSEISTLAKTASGVMMGTVPYMSPEQALGKDVDHRSDLFSLGVVLYEMATGRLPFAGANMSETLDRILHSQPDSIARLNYDVSAEFERIVNKALRKDREQRYQTSKDLLIDLKDLKEEMAFAAKLERSGQPEPKESLQATITTTEEPTAVPAISSTKIILSEVKRHKLGVGLAVIVIVIAALGSFFWFNRAAPLTDKDTILLADFVNTTGEAVFDDTLKQALAVQLEQSPFMNIFSEERVHEALRFMGRSPNERVTRDLAREICQRQGLKAMLLGSIAKFDRNYAITLEAVNAQTGETIAGQQVEAEGKDQVLKALGSAATKLREKLGESLASLQKFDAPIEQATTSSLEALMAFSQGNEQRDLGKPLGAIPFYQRAVELDPNFALAWANLAMSHSSLKQEELAAKAAEKAFELRERVSERERFVIVWRYQRDVTKEMASDKLIETLELWKRTYPHEVAPRYNLIGIYSNIGQFEKATEEAREAIRLNPNFAGAYSNLAWAFIRLNRFDEAKESCERALQQKLDSPIIHNILYLIAFVQGDEAAMKQQIGWATGRPEEFEMLRYQSDAAMFSGRLRLAQELSSRVVAQSLRHNLREYGGEQMALEALWSAAWGNCPRVREVTARASAHSRTLSSLLRGGIANALCGQTRQAQSLADEMVKRYPKEQDTEIFVPVIRAAIEIQLGNRVQALQILQAASHYESKSYFFQNYLRGQAYLGERKGAEAAAEFQKILDHRGWSPTSELYVPAHLWLARTAVMQGDLAKARKEYQDFFALWKDADADLQILNEARKEYEKLK